MKNIMLACSAGMSTSLLVNKMKEAAAAQGIEANIAAYSSSEAEQKLTSEDVDVLLLGPQVRFMQKQFEDLVADKNIPVAVIDMADYGMMNGENVLKTALNLIDEAQK